MASENFETHFEILKLMTTLGRNGLKIQHKKCKYYLAAGITPKRSHLDAIRNNPEPKSQLELQRCRGLFSYFRRFVPIFSRIAYPMSQLLRFFFFLDTLCIYL